MSDPSSAQRVIEHLGLKPLPGEGGYYRETYRSSATLDDRDSKPHATAIYYLLTRETYSAFHKLASDEIYHFYAGDPVEMFLLDPGEAPSLLSVELGSDFFSGRHCQFVVPRGVWQASRLLAGGKWALMGTTVAPGFDFSDCTLADVSLCEQYPEHAALIESFLARP